MTLSDARSVLKARLGNGHAGDPAKSELCKLLWEAEEVWFDPGALLFKEGDMPHVRPGLFLLVTGTMKVLPKGAGPTAVVLAEELIVRRPGAFLGHGGARLVHARNATVRAGSEGAGLLWWQDVEFLEREAPRLWSLLADETWRIGLESNQDQRGVLVPASSC